MTEGTDRLAGFHSSLENIAKLLEYRAVSGSEQWCAEYNQLELFSHFQPIYSYALHRQVGFEALVRGLDQNNKIVMPAQIFRGDSIEEMLAIDRICRSLHLANFTGIQEQADTWLFLNVNPLIVSEHMDDRTPFMREVLEANNIPAHRVVIEILETAITNERKFKETIEYYREIGCMIAIDDFGSGHSNFNRIWDCHPDFVKLDRSIFVEAMENRKLQKSIPRLVSLLHEYGCMVLAEGIETYEQATLCMDSEFDLIQGFLFSEPAPVNDLTDQSDEIWSTLKNRFKSDVRYKTDEMQEFLRPYIEEFHYLAMSLKSTQRIDQNCKNMLNRKKVVRFYLINEDGEQKSSNINSSEYQENNNPLYAPLQGVNKATWYHRQYFRKAINNPGKMQVTGPYFSITDARICITLSLARKINDVMVVLCCDIEA